MAPLERTLTIQLENKVISVPVAVDLPTSISSLGVLLGHGEGGDLHAGNMSAWAAAAAQAGCVCVRYTCKSPNLQHRTAVCKGGRVACQVAHDLPHVAAACLLLSYPLHPPRKPEQLRDAPLAALRLPILFVRGTRDEFCTLEQWELLLPRLHSASCHTVEGGNHGLQLSANSGGTAASQAVLDAACAAVQRFLLEVAQASGQPWQHEADRHQPQPQQRKRGRKQAEVQASGHSPQQASKRTRQ